ncbi:MAG: hypothetical protein JRF49_10225, partial [Deltaproteobacteria bacterium]|nr:hypothetical protein [Deltaproteobacteria bacterium]
MNKSIGSVLILIFTIICGILLYIWYYQQKDITRVPSIEEERSNKQTKNLDLSFSKTAKDAALMVLIPEWEFFMGNHE